MKSIAIIIVGRGITLNKAIKKRSKEIIPNMKQRWWELTLQGSKEKSSILRYQYWKINRLYCTNNMFVNFRISGLNQFKGIGGVEMALHVCTIHTLYSVHS